MFAEQLARLDRKLLRRIKKVGFRDADSPGELATAYDRYSEIVSAGVEGIDKLDPPQWAADQTGRYLDALLDLQSISDEYSALLDADRGKAWVELDLEKYTQMDKEIDRAADAEFRARKKMLRALGAAPTFGPGEAPEAEDEQVS